MAAAPTATAPGCGRPNWLPWPPTPACRSPSATCHPAPRNGVAVGTALTGGPPHGSRRAELPHRAPASGSGCEAHVRVGMHHTDLRKPPSCVSAHPRPGDPTALAAPPKRPPPVQADLVPEGRYRVGIARHGVVGDVPLQHPGQPPSLHRDGIMHATPERACQDVCVSELV